MYQLRDYQRSACDATWSYLLSTPGNPVVELPTGAGKSLCIADLCREAVQKWNGRVLVLAHRKELLSQNAEKIVSLLPDIPVGIYSAGLKMRHTDKAVVCCGIQSVHKRAAEFGARHLVIIDEVHLVPTAGEGMYRAFLDYLRSINPKLRMVGMTATPYRTGEGALCRPDGLFQQICYTAPIPRLIEQGYLSRIISNVGDASADTSKLHIRAGEFINSEMEQLFDVPAVVKAACAEIVAKSVGRQSVLVFCSGVEHAKHVAQELSTLTGERCGTVTGDTLPIERANTLSDFRNRWLRWLTNVDVLTTGFDAPCIDCIAILRATCSPGLFSQICGRGFRLFPGKENCIAECQRVLTDSGLVEIQNVTREMKLWDGVEFVSHDGVISKGNQNVIEYAGISATPDHQVWTKKGWMPIGEAKLSQAEISVTGFGRQAIREASHYFRRDSSQGAGSRACPYEVHGVRSRIYQGTGFSNEVGRRLSQVRQPANGSALAGAAGQSGQGSVRKSEQQEICGLRRTRNTVLLRLAPGHGEMDSRQLGTEAGSANRPNQERPALRSRKPAIRNPVAAADEHQKTATVYDIVNAGPRHRFTCEGLLVSNCVILDFGENILRHGPLDAIDFGKPKKKNPDAEAPTKKCINCEQDVPLSAAVCPFCGFQFPPRELKHGEEADKLAQILSKPQDWLVEEVNMSRHRKAKGVGPDTLRVDYICRPPGYEGNLALEKISEWVCLDHDGWSGQKAQAWWRKRSDADPVADDNGSWIDSCIDWWKRGAVATPTKITTIREGKFYRITNYVLDPIPPEEDWQAEAVRGDVFETEELPF